MKTWFRPTTLHIQKPLGSTFLLSILVIFLIFAVGEGALRILVHMNWISVPYLGTYNAELDIKIRMLDQIVANSGSIDCIFLGSSQFDNAVDPQIFTSQYTADSGQSITCFNFSLQTLTASPAGLIAEILVKRYHPSLIIYGTSARDFSTNFGEAARPLLEDAWVRSYLGDFNLKGWLMEHSYVVRLPVSLYRRFSTEYHDHLLMLTTSLTPYGNTPVEDNDLSNPKTDFIPEYIISSQDMEGLEELTDIISMGTQVIVVEVPVHNTFLPFYVEANADSYSTKFIKPISEFLDQHQVPFWQTQDIMQSLIPDQGWNDVKHLNTIGAEIYSRWLAQRLFLAVSSAEIQDPFH